MPVGDDDPRHKHEFGVMGGYRTAAICVSGHTITDAVELINPGNFCSQCGAVALTQCPKCQAPIRGEYYVEGFFGPSDYVSPSFCFHCGEPFPWTTEKLKAAKELADEIVGLSPEDRGRLKEALTDVAAGGPRTEIGAVRIKALLGNASSQSEGLFGKSPSKSRVRPLKKS
jgi:hypothetical protein